MRAMRGIFETAEGATFVREVERVQDIIQFALLPERAYWANGDAGPLSTPIYKTRRYRLFDRCQNIALYREVVE